MLPVNRKLHCRKHCRSELVSSTKKLCPGLNHQHNISDTVGRPKDFKNLLHGKRNEESQDGPCEFRVTPTLKTYAGPRQKHNIMGPHQLKVCRICFAMDCQLHLLIGNMKLYRGYEAITGLTLADEEDLPPYLCADCAEQLLTCAHFRHKSLQAHLMLLDILKKHDRISLEIIKDAIKIQTPINYDTVIEHTPKEMTDVRNKKKRGAATDGIKKEINVEHKQSEDVPLIRIKTEINETNEGEESVVNTMNKEKIDMNMECEGINVDSIKRENDDLSKDDDGILSVNKTQTKGSESNKECDVNTNVNSIKGEVDDVNKNWEDIASASTKTNANKDCDETTVNNVKTIHNQSNKGAEFNDSRSKMKISNTNKESGEITVNKMKTRINDINKESEEIIISNKIKTEIDDVGGQYNDISIEIIKTEVNEEIDEITADGDNFLANTYEVAVVPNLADVNNMVKPNALGDGLINDEVDNRQMDTGKDVSLGSSLASRLEDNLKTMEETEEMELTKDNLLRERKNKSCEICDRINSESAYKEYRCDCFNSDLNNQSNSDKPFECNECKKKFTRKCNLAEHLRVHDQDNPFLCKICNKLFTRQINLDDHMRLHSGDRPFMCDICKRTYIRKSSLEEHLRNHSGDKPFKCTVCKKAFTRKIGLDEHFRIHSGDKPFVCRVCSKAFSRKRRLEEHMRNHSMNNPLICDICKKSFTRKSNLEVHLRYHARVKPFLCKLCKKSFKRKSSLSEHVRTHLGLKPFLCKICKKSFTRKNNLNEHLRTHTGRKPYKCDVCDKSFCLNGNLQKHLMIHYGNRPYPCHLCDNFFRQKSHLQRHLLTHSGSQLTTPP